MGLFARTKSRNFPRCVLHGIFHYWSQENLSSSLKHFTGFKKLHSAVASNYGLSTRQNPLELLPLSPSSTSQGKMNHTHLRQLGIRQIAASNQIRWTGRLVFQNGSAAPLPSSSFLVESRVLKYIWSSLIDCHLQDDTTGRHPPLDGTLRLHFEHNTTLPLLRSLRTHQIDQGIIRWRIIYWWHVFG